MIIQLMKGAWKMKIRQKLKKELSRRFNKVVKAENTYYPFSAAVENLEAVMGNPELSESKIREDLLGILRDLRSTKMEILEELDHVRFKYEETVQEIADEQNLFYVVDGELSFPEEDKEEPEEK